MSPVQSRKYQARNSAGVRITYIEPPGSVAAAKGLGRVRSSQLAAVAANRRRICSARSRRAQSSVTLMKLDTDLWSSRAASVTARRNAGGMVMMSLTKRSAGDFRGRPLLVMTLSPHILGNLAAYSVLLLIQLFLGRKFAVELLFN